jgi:hypothetical protein
MPPGLPVLCVSLLLLLRRQWMRSDRVDYDSAAHDANRHDGRNHDHRPVDHDAIEDVRRGLRARAPLMGR